MADRGKVRKRRLGQKREKPEPFAEKQGDSKLTKPPAPGHHGRGRQGRKHKPKSNDSRSLVLSLPSVNSKASKARHSDITQLSVPPTQIKRSLGTKCVAFMFTEVGLITMVVLYIVLGGLLMQLIELPAEIEAANEVRIIAAYMQNNRTKMVQDIQRTIDMAVNEHDEVFGVPREWATKRINLLLEEHQQRMIQAIKLGYDGTVHLEEDESYGWSTTSSILFTASTLTTIGYGHVAPKTELGRLTCIIYSVIALPVLSIFVIKVGGGIGKFIRFAYNRVFCRMLANKREHSLIMSMIDNGQDEDGSTTQQWKMLMYVQTIRSPRYDYWRATPPATLMIVFVLAYLFTGAAFFSVIEGWSMLSSIYCSFATMTTIGLGDMVPGFSFNGKSILGQLLLAVTSVYVVVGLAVLAMGLDIVAEALYKMYETTDAATIENELVEETQRLQGLKEMQRAITADTDRLNYAPIDFDFDHN